MDEDRYAGCLIGLAVGDAVGVAAEFSPRGSFSLLTDMIGGGPFGLPPGAWTDDTSMALCLAQSLIDRDGFDPADQMDRYCAWQRDGYLSSTGKCFDIGNTVSAALERYRSSRDPFSGSTDPRSAGNGAIMRLAPVPMFFCGSQEETIHYSGESSRTTHGAPEAVDCARLFGVLIRAALLGSDKQAILQDHGYEPQTAAVRAIARCEYRSKEEDQVRGTGYVVHSLEAALWCFLRAGSYREAVLLAANLGEDADTTAAICGQLAGAFHGASAIPPHWRERIALAAQIEQTARQLFARRRAYGVRGA